MRGFQYSPKAKRALLKRARAARSRVLRMARVRPAARRVLELLGRLT